MDIEKLKELYYDPSQGFGSLYQLWKLAKENNLDLSSTNVKNFYYSQPSNQVYSNPEKKYHKINCNFGICLQLDLMDVSKFYKWNKPTKFLLNVLDVYSRYAWSYPLSSKDSKPIAKYVDKILSDIRKVQPYIIITIITDSGSEFINNDFRKLIKKYHIFKHYVVNSKQENHPNKTAIVERFNRTLWSFIKKYTLANNTLEFVNKLPEFLENYNNREHSTLSISISKNHHVLYLFYHYKFITFFF